MGDSTIQPTNDPAGKKKWRAAWAWLVSALKNWTAATWVALVSALVATAALGLAAWQGHIHTREHIEAEQQQLVTLTTQIAEQFAQKTAATNKQISTPTGKVAQSNKVAEIVAKLTVEGQAGAVLIDELKGEKVAGMEYIEVAEALEEGGDYARALTYANTAFNAAPDDAETRATALRALAKIHYFLGRNATAHQDLMRAVKVYPKDVVEPRSYMANSIAQAYLTDAYYQVLYVRDCQSAKDDKSAAQNSIRDYGMNAVVSNLKDQIDGLYKSNCQH